MSVWNIMAMIGAELTLDGEFAPTPAINTYVDGVHHLPPPDLPLVRSRRDSQL